MTFEQETDYEALSLISKDKKYTNGEFVKLFSNFLTPQKAAELHARFVTNEYYKQTVDGVPEYMINERALFYFTYLQREKAKEDADLKLKQITYDSAKINKLLPLYALAIALITAITPYFIYRISKDNVQKTNTELPQLKQVQAIQERMLQMQQQYLDSLTKLLKNKN